MKKGRYILLYSEKAAKQFDYCSAITLDGIKVDYMAMYDTSSFESDDDWRTRYCWDDAIVVGYINDMSSICKFVRPVDIFQDFLKKW